MGLMILSRLDGSRIASLPGMSNIVKQSEKIYVQMIGVSKNASLPVNIKSSQVGTVKTDQYGQGTTLITFDVEGGKSYPVNVPDTAMSTSYVESVYVQAAPAPASTSTSTTPSGSQSGGSTPTQTPSQTTSTTPTQTTSTAPEPRTLLGDLKEVEEWFRRNLIPVLFIALMLILAAVFTGTKAGRKAIARATGAPIKR